MGTTYPRTPGLTVRWPDRLRGTLTRPRRVAPGAPRAAGHRVPSFRHEILVDLFRKRGELAWELLRGARIAFDHDRVAPGSIDLSQVVSTAYRADAVTELHDRDGKVIAVAIVEVQLAVDLDKRYSWPLYVTAARANLRCPAVLLVIAPEPAVAAWARASIALGHPGFCLAPLVVSFADLPRVTDAAVAGRLPELAVLSAMAHPELDVAITAVDAVLPLPEDLRKLYLDVVLAALPPLLRQALEARMKGYVYQSEYARRYYGQGLEEGLEKGREEGREQGLHAAVLAIARAKLGAVSEQDEAVIRALRDDGELIALNTALGLARGEAEARAALERLRAR